MNLILRRIQVDKNTYETLIQSGNISYDVSMNILRMHISGNETHVGKYINKGQCY
jgi:hypothetical protein